MWIFSKNKITDTLGIDININSISIVKLAKKDNNRFDLVNYGILINKKKIIQTDDGIFEERDITLMLKNLLEEMGEIEKLKKLDVVMSIPHNISLMFNITIPQISDQELDRAVIFESRGLLPVAPSTVEINWQIISKNEKELKILVIAVPKEIIAQYKNIAKNLGLKIKTLEIRTFSLIRALDIDTKNILLVDFNSKSFNISFIKDGLMHISNTDKFIIADSEAFSASNKTANVDKLLNGINRFISAFPEKINKIALFSSDFDVNLIKKDLAKTIKISIDTPLCCSKIEYKDYIKNSIKEKMNVLISAIGLAMY